WMTKSDSLFWPDASLAGLRPVEIHRMAPENVCSARAADAICDCTIGWREVSEFQADLAAVTHAHGKLTTHQGPG
ncbi:MAG TPA: hypothetical protein VK789_04780, partial [Bryobacteraceae bacterium]|nr:hypothetical protein [Bryobacteraceae bacterium]